MGDLICDIDIPLCVAAITSNSRDAAGAASALCVAASQPGGASLCVSAGALPALVGILHSSRARGDALRALASIALEAPGAVGATAGAALCGLLPEPAAFDALTNVAADAAAAAALAMGPAGVAARVVACVAGGGASGGAAVSLASNLAATEAGCVALHRAGAAAALVDALAAGWGRDAGARERLPVAAPSAAAALVALCGLDAAARLCGQLLERQPRAVSALARAAAREGALARGDGSDSEETSMQPRLLLQALLEGGHWSPTPLLLDAEAGAVGAVLGLLDEERGWPARTFALACLARWEDPLDGLALLAAPPSGSELACAASLAALAPHRAVFARALAQRPEAVRLLVGAWAGGRCSVASAHAALRRLAARAGEEAGLGGGEEAEEAEQRAPAAAKRAREGGGRAVRSGAKRGGGEGGGATTVSAAEALAALAARGAAPDLCAEGELSESALAALESALVVTHRARGAFPQTGEVTLRAAGRWRVLRFDGTDQGVSYAGRSGEPDSRVLGLEYIRSMAVAGAAFCEAAAGARLTRRGARVLCVGLGTGALPCFIARAFPKARVRVAEVDPIVTEVVRSVLRAPVAVEGGARGGRAVAGAVVAVVHGDAAEVLSAEAPGALSLIFLDAYNKSGAVPPHLTAPPFLRACGAALTEGGALVCNVWNGAAGSAARAGAEAFCAAVGDALGAAFAVKVQKQQSNLVVVGVKRGGGGGGDAAYSRAALVAHARRVGAGWAFDPGAALGAVFAVRPLRGGGVGEALLGREGTSAVDLTLFTAGE